MPPKTTASAEAPPPPESPQVPPPEPAPPLLSVVLEPLYSELGHPQLASEMLTLARDEELFQWALGGSENPAHPSNQPGYHPATRVVVDVELKSRAPVGTTKRLLRIARSDGYWPLRACFEAAERVAPKRERHATVRLTLSAYGKVLGSRSLGRGPERDYADCVRGRIRTLDFRPGFSRKLDVDISVKQWPGHAPVPPRAPATAPAPHTSPEVLTALEQLKPALEACYAAGLKGDVKLWGRIAFHLAVDGEGQVTAATPSETRFPNDAVVECAHQALLGVRLPGLGVQSLSFAFRLGQPAPPAPAVSEGAPPASEGAPPPPPAPVLPPAPSH